MLLWGDTELVVEGMVLQNPIIKLIRVLIQSKHSFECGSIRMYQDMHEQRCKCSFHYPDFLHVVPVSYDAVLDRIFQGEDASL